MRPTNYPTRDCETCVHWEAWKEHGYWIGDCSHKTQSMAVWRINLEEWGIDPAQYCDDYEFASWTWDYHKR